jgi:hypothetical protein
MSLATTAAIWTFLYALSKERLKLPSAAARRQSPINVPRGEQLYPLVPLFASVHAADHFL